MLIFIQMLKKHFLRLQSEHVVSTPRDQPIVLARLNRHNLFSRINLILTQQIERNNPRRRMRFRKIHRRGHIRLRLLLLKDLIAGRLLRGPGNRRELFLAQQHIQVNFLCVLLLKALLRDIRLRIVRVILHIKLLQILLPLFPLLRHKHFHIRVLRVDRLLLIRFRNRKFIRQKVIFLRFAELQLSFILFHRIPLHHAVLIKLFRRREVFQILRLPILLFFLRLNSFPLLSLRGRGFLHKIWEELLLVFLHFPHQIQHL